MAFSINNFVIDRVLRGVMTSTADNSVLWAISQITAPTLSITADSVDVVDAIGARIAQFDRAKTATLSGSNALFDLSLAAAQFGTTKNVADTGNLIQVPNFESLTVSGTTVTLQYVPVGTTGAETPFIYAINGDDTLGTPYGIAATANATSFALDADTKVLTVPTGLATGTRLFVMYDYMSGAANEVVATGIDFPTAGKFVMEVLGQDVCNQSVKYHAYIIFGSAKLSSSVDIAFTPDGGHPFEIAANQDYCDPQKRLFSIVIPDLGYVAA